MIYGREKDKKKQKENSSRHIYFFFLSFLSCLNNGLKNILFFISLLYYPTQSLSLVEKKHFLMFSHQESQTNYVRQMNYR